MFVIDIDVKELSNFGYRKIVGVSIYYGSRSNFGNGKPCVCVTMLDGGECLV